MSDAERSELAALRLALTALQTAYEAFSSESTATAEVQGDAITALNTSTGDLTGRVDAFELDIVRLDGRIDNTPSWELAFGLRLDGFYLTAPSGKRPVVNGYTINVRPQAAIAVQPFGLRVQRGPVILSVGIYVTFGFTERLGQFSSAIGFGAGGNFSAMFIVKRNGRFIVAMGPVRDGGGDVRNVFMVAEQASMVDDVALSSSVGHVGLAYGLQFGERHFSGFVHVGGALCWTPLPDGTVGSGGSATLTTGIKIAFGG